MFGHCRPARLGDVSMNTVRCHFLLQALSYCLDCGFVLTEGDLDISVLFDASTGGPSGIILAKDDDGSRAGEPG